MTFQNGEFMNKRSSLFLLLIVISSLLYAGCVERDATASTSEKPFSGHEIDVCAGAGLIMPMTEIINNFENETGASIIVHYAGAAEIFGILSAGKCDVFIPGSYYYTAEGMRKGYVDNTTVNNITLHIPMIITPEDNPAGIIQLEDLSRPGVRLALGDPNGPAIGKITKKICKENGIWENVSNNTETFTLTVNQLLLYVTTKQVDAAIIWADMASWEEGRGNIHSVEISPEKNLIRTIPTAIARSSRDREVAGAFNEYVTNKQSLLIWEKHGFDPV